jgi:flavin-dependent dehydrogenase
MTTQLPDLDSPPAAAPATTTAACPVRSEAEFDVIVVGGGPAGATIATLLARQGRRVLVFEKARHPRFHIGESLLPANVPLLEQLGVLEQVAAIGMPKWGVEFVSPQHAEPAQIEFADAWDKSQPMAWQVRRAEFDHILLNQARRSGAEVQEDTAVTAVAFDGQGVSVTARQGTQQLQRRARFLVDASGRDALLATQLGWKRRSKRHNSAALFAHFRGARRLPGRQEGNISIFWFRHGWFWFIPLADGTTSVGAVCWPEYLKSRRGPLQQFLLDTIAAVPALAARLEGATLVDDKVWATGNYSYSSSHCTGERFLLLGDAYAFVDPVFSSGVYLAMVGAFEGVDVIAAALDEPQRQAAASRRFRRVMAHGPRQFSWFIHRMTNPAIRELFMHPANPLRMQEAVLSVLAGDIYGRSPIFPSLWAFRLVYWATSLAMLPRSAAAWWRRRSLVRDAGTVPGENVMGSPS